MRKEEYYVAQTKISEQSEGAHIAQHVTVRQGKVYLFRQCAGKLHCTKLDDIRTDAYRGQIALHTCPVCWCLVIWLSVRQENANVRCMRMSNVRTVSCVCILDSGGSEDGQCAQAQGSALNSALERSRFATIIYV
jgi:hypothetical protein